MFRLPKQDVRGKRKNKCGGFERVAMKKIVLCGSMSFEDEMRKCATVLGNRFIVVVPEEGDWSDVPLENRSEYKRQVSRKHFDEIASEDTVAVLVVNESKRGTDNYIGANTLAEIAVAFYFNKKIYLLNDMYEPYIEELCAWECIPLYGEIEKLI